MSKSTQKPNEYAFAKGSYVRNGSSRPGLIVELVELKPGYPKAWVQWEGSQFPVAEDPEALKVIEAWALDWRWNKDNQLVRLHDNKKCNDLRFIVRELELILRRLANARSRQDLEEVKDKEEKVAHLRSRKIKAIVIDQQFQSLMPPLSPEDKNQLEENLKQDGCSEPISVWGNILLDGHNRFELCQKNRLDFKIEFIECIDRSSAHDWIIKRQLGRRNLNKDWISHLRGELYNTSKSKRGGNKGNRHTKKRSMNNNDSHLAIGQNVPLVEVNSNDSHLAIGQNVPLVDVNGNDSHLAIGQNVPLVDVNGNDSHLAIGQNVSLVDVNGNDSNLPISEKENVARKLGQEFGVDERTIKRDGEYAKAIDKICYNFGQEWRSTLIDSKLTKAQIKEIAEHADSEDFCDEIDAILNDVQHKDSFKLNYKLFQRKLNPQKIAIGQLVKIQFTHKSGLTLVEKHSDREYGRVIEILDFSYKIELLKRRVLLIKEEDIQPVSVAEYPISFSAYEFEQLLDRFESGRDIEEEIKKLIFNN